MPSLRSLAVFTIVGFVGFAAQVSEAALAQAAGGSGLSGTLSKNKAIRKQQLIADPAEPIYGSISITYDPSVVTLSGLIFGPGYTGTGVVELDGEGGPYLLDIDSWLSEPFGDETGYAQVFFAEPTIITAASVPFAAPTHGQITPPTGYGIIDNDGPAAVDTHAFFFDYHSTVPDSTIATYRIFASAGDRESENDPDFLDDGTTRIPFGSIASATVSGSLDSPAVPVPPAVWMGGLTMLGALAYSKLRRPVAA